MSVSEKSMVRQQRNAGKRQETVSPSAAEVSPAASAETVNQGGTARNMQDIGIVLEKDRRVFFRDDFDLSSAQCDNNAN